jgi:hypothetical protein
MWIRHRREGEVHGSYGIAQVTGLSRHQMKLYVNAWYSAWLVRKSQDADSFVLVDQIRHAQNEQRRGHRRS